MIDLLQTRMMDERRLWSEHVRSIFRTLGLDTRDAAEAVSESLAVVCQQQSGFSGNSLTLLMARGWCVAGDVEAADAVLSRERTCQRYAGPWLQVLSIGEPFPEIYPLLSARILHPLHLQTIGGATAWVLDLTRVQAPEACCHELIRFRVLRTLAERIACVWQTCGGNGSLAVKGLRCFIGSDENRAAADRARAHLQDVLALTARKNGWPSVPYVLTLDL